MPKKTKKKSSVSENDIVFAILAYLGILFIVPLVAAKDSKFAMYHANQGLVLFLTLCVGVLVSNMLNVVLIGFLLTPIVIICGAIMALIGIVNAANKQTKPLPVIGGISLIK